MSSPEQSAKSVNELLKNVDLDFDVDGVAFHYTQDSVGNDCYYVVLRSGVVSTVSSAHLLEERKIQLLRRYPLTENELGNSN